VAAACVTATARVTSTRPSVPASTTGDGRHRMRWGSWVVGALRRTATARVASIEPAMRRRAYSVTPPPAPATVVIARPLVHVHAAIANSAAIVIAITAITSRYAAADNSQ
jgi:hypothetical protein